MRGVLPLQGIIPLFGQLQHTESARGVHTLQQYWSILLGPDRSDVAHKYCAISSRHSIMGIVVDSLT